MMASPLFLNQKGTQNKLFQNFSQRANLLKLLRNPVQAKFQTHAAILLHSLVPTTSLVLKVLRKGDPNPHGPMQCSQVPCPDGACGKSPV